MTDSSLETMRLHSHPEFQTWLANDLEVRDELNALIGDELGIDADSLDTLEASLLERYASPDDALRLPERAVLDAAARHIGLVLLLAIDGAEWAIELDDADNAYYRLPIIRLPDGAEACPLGLATAALDRRSGGYLRRVFENYEEDYDGARKT